MAYELSRTLGRKTPKSLYRCILCEEWFSKAYVLQSHMGTAHELFEGESDEDDGDFDFSFDSDIADITESNENISLRNSQRESSSDVVISHSGHIDSRLHAQQAESGQVSQNGRSFHDHTFQASQKIHQTSSNSSGPNTCESVTSRPNSHESIPISICNERTCLSPIEDNTAHMSSTCESVTDGALIQEATRIVERIFSEHDYTRNQRPPCVSQLSLEQLNQIAAIESRTLLTSEQNPPISKEVVVDAATDSEGSSDLTMESDDRSLQNNVTRSIEKTSVLPLKEISNVARSVLPTEEMIDQSAPSGGVVQVQEAVNRVDAEIGCTFLDEENEADAAAAALIEIGRRSMSGKEKGHGYNTRGADERKSTIREKRKLEGILSPRKKTGKKSKIEGKLSPRKKKKKKKAVTKKSKKTVTETLKDGSKPEVVTKLKKKKGKKVTNKSKKIKKSTKGVKKAKKVLRTSKEEGKEPMEGGKPLKGVNEASKGVSKFKKVIKKTKKVVKKGRILKNANKKGSTKLKTPIIKSTKGVGKPVRGDEQPKKSDNQKAGFRCEYCKQLYKSRGQLGQHKIRECGYDSHRCDPCVQYASKRSAKEFEDIVRAVKKARDFTDRSDYKYVAGRKLLMHYHQCFACNEGFTHYHHYSRHLNTHHTVSCQFCYLVYSSVRTLGMHIRCHDRGPLKCSSCTRTYFSTGMLLAHMKGHTGNFTCHHCNFTYATKAVFLTHLKLHHPDQNTTPAPGKGDRKSPAPAPTKGQEQVPKSVVAQNDPSLDKTFHCEFCNNIFRTELTLESHVQRFHKDKVEVDSGHYVCEICGAVKHNENALRKHVQSHQGLRNVCSHCGKSFSQQQALKVHIESVHEKKKRFQCQYCGKSITSKASLLDHERLHTGDRPHKCDKCDKSFRVRPDLMMHKGKEHSDLRPFKCPVCPKRFPFRSKLQSHMKMHGPKEKCTCCECGQVFERADLLKEHMVKHRQVIRCEQCDSKFSSRVALYYHLSKIHKIEPYRIHRNIPLYSFPSKAEVPAPQESSSTLDGETHIKPNS